MDMVDGLDGYRSKDNFLCNETQGYYKQKIVLCKLEISKKSYFL